MEMARHHAYGSLGLGPDPGLAFAGVRALRELAEFCQGYPVRRLREAGHSWAQIAAWAGVSPQAVHKKHAQTIKVTKGPSTYLSSAHRCKPAPPALYLRCGARRASTSIRRRLAASASGRPANARSGSGTDA